MSDAEKLLDSLTEVVHEHDVVDTDVRFTIDPFSRTISSSNGQKTILIQGDHKSERFTFEIPRYIEGHDMLLCDIVRIPYINSEVDGRNPKYNIDVHTVGDLQVDPKNDKQLIFSWTVSDSGTMYEGVLTFSVVFLCLNGKRVTYRFGTDVYENMFVRKTPEIESTFELRHLDIIEQWKDEVRQLFTAYIDNEVDKHIDVAREALSEELTNDLDEAASLLNERISVLNSRMDVFSTLKEGSTTGDAELEDIRVGYDGAIYPSAGAAVRDQVGGLIDSVGRVWFAKGVLTAKHAHIITPFSIAAGDFVKIDVLDVKPEPATSLKAFGYVGTDDTNIPNVKDGVFFTCPDDYDNIHASFSYSEETKVTYSLKFTVIKEGDLLWNDREKDEKLDLHESLLLDHGDRIERLSDLVVYHNEVNPETTTSNASINVDDGSLSTGSVYLDATDYIKLNKNTTYYVGHIYLSNFYAFYDMNKRFISDPDVEVTWKGSGWGGTIVVGNEPLYFRGSFTTGENWKIYISRFVDEHREYRQIPYDEHVKSLIYKEINGSKLNGKKILVLGDSISADYYGSYNKWVTNLINDEYFPKDVKNDSIHATGFVATYNNEANDFVTRIKAIDNPSEYDLVIVFGGINDCIKSVALDSSFKPAVDEFFTYLLNNFTQARICVLTPLRTRYSQNKNSAGCTVDSYSDYIKQVAKSYCVPVLDLTNESGFCPQVDAFNSMWTLIPEGYTDNDGVHPNAEYEKKFLTPMIRHFIDGLV